MKKAVVYNDDHGVPVIAHVEVTSKRASRQRNAIIAKIGDVPYRFVDETLPDGRISFGNVAGRHDFPDFRLFVGDTQVAYLSRSGGCYGMIINAFEGFSWHSLSNAISFGTNEHFLDNLQY